LNLHKPQGEIINKSARHIKGLGDVSVRVTNIDAMQKFNEVVLGHEVLKREESFAFFKIVADYGGHPQVLNPVLATFGEGTRPTG
jgi:hypothetical protein